MFWRPSSPSLDPSANAAPTRPLPVPLPLTKRPKRSKHPKRKPNLQCEHCGELFPPQHNDCSPCPRCRLLPDGSDPLIGQTISRYQLLRRVEGGLLSIVYQAIELENGRMVALKRAPALSIQRLGDRAKFLRVLGKWRLFHHPCAPHILHFFEVDDGGYCWVSPWLEATPLSALLRTHRTGLAIPTVYEVSEQLCNTLQALHEYGWFHGQMRPEQLFLVRQSQGIRVLLSDLGWGPMLGEHFRHTHLPDEGTLRALRYLSPEQLLQTPSKLDARADIYATAGIVFHMLTGRLPYPTRSPEELYQQHLYAPPARLNMACPHRRFPPLLENYLRRAMAKQPQDRFPSMLSFWEAISPLLGETQELQKQNAPPSMSTQLSSSSVPFQTTLPPPSEEAATSPSAPLSEEQFYLGNAHFRPWRLSLFLLLMAVLVWWALH